MKRSSAIALILLLIGIAWIFLSADPDSDEGRRRNATYMQERLGAIVLEFYANYGTVPAHFNLALNESDETLPNRGDYYGRPMIYQKLTEDSFRFVAFGENGKYDAGSFDDVVVEYADQRWTNNVE